LSWGWWEAGIRDRLADVRCRLLVGTNRKFRAFENIVSASFGAETRNRLAFCPKGDKLHRSLCFEKRHNNGICRQLSISEQRNAGVFRASRRCNPVHVACKSTAGSRGPNEYGQANCQCRPDLFQLICPTRSKVGIGTCCTHPHGVCGCDVFRPAQQ
jgi:hypothetical protein